MEQAVPHAIDDPPGGQRLDGRLIFMGVGSGDVVKGLAHLGNRHGLYVGVLALQPGAGRGFFTLRHGDGVPHAVEAVFVLPRP